MASYENEKMTERSRRTVIGLFIAHTHYIKLIQFTTPTHAHICVHMLFVPQGSLLSRQMVILCGSFLAIEGKIFEYLNTTVSTENRLHLSLMFRYPSEVLVKTTVIYCTTK